MSTPVVRVDRLWRGGQRLQGQRCRPASATRTDRRWLRGYGHRRADSSSAASRRERRAGAGAPTLASSRTAPGAPPPPWNSERRRGGRLGSEPVVAAPRWLVYRWLHPAQPWLATSLLIAYSLVKL